MDQLVPRFPASGEAICFLHFSTAQKTCRRPPGLFRGVRGVRSNVSRATRPSTGKDLQRGPACTWLLGLGGKPCRYPQAKLYLRPTIFRALSSTLHPPYPFLRPPSTKGQTPLANHPTRGRRAH